MLQSTTSKVLKCNTTNGLCPFSQGYLEGSSYSGYKVSDEIWFGEDYHHGHGAIKNFTFACVEKETKYFYS